MDGCFHHTISSESAGTASLDDRSEGKMGEGFKRKLRRYSHESIDEFVCLELFSVQRNY